MNLPPLYLNGFPKSGTHMADLMVEKIYKPFMYKNWLGTNAWTDKPVALERLPILSLLKPGQYIKGHAGYSEDMEKMLTGLGFCVIFIYRDLRDVVVSQAHHILSNNKDLYHPARELYPDNLQDVMKVVIEGFTEHDGVFARWASFEPWLSKPWVFPIRYRDLRLQTNRIARDFLHYLASMDMFYSGKQAMQLDRKTVNRFVDEIAKNTKQKTVTFRKGRVGSWRDEFTPELVMLFKKHDKNDALIRLGFEKNRNWN